MLNRSSTVENVSICFVSSGAFSASPDPFHESANLRKIQDMIQSSPFCRLSRWKGYHDVFRTRPSRSRWTKHNVKVISELPGCSSTIIWMLSRLAEVPGCILHRDQILAADHYCAKLGAAWRSSPYNQS